VYPDPEVVEFIDTHFVPVRVHVKEQGEQFKELGTRFGALWTPTTLIIDQSGQERHRIEGFLPKDEFLAQLRLGLAHAAFNRQQFDEAERQFRAIVEELPESEAAPEALYGAGVARYKATHDPTALASTADAFKTRYTDTNWAKKASVWSR